MGFLKKAGMAWRSAKAAWVQPGAEDESIWTGSPSWGATSLRYEIADPGQQIKQNVSLVGICVDYNSRAMARQKLRLYATKNVGGGKVVTKKIDGIQLNWLKKNAGLYQYLKKAEEVVEVVEHPWLTMMKNVSPVLNKTSLWMLTETYMGLTGECFWYMRPNTLGLPFQIWVLESHMMDIKKGEGFDDIISYYTYNGGKAPQRIEVKDVCHFKYPNPESMLRGLSPVKRLSDSISINKELFSYLHRQFKKVDEVIEVEESLGDKEYKRLKRELKKKGLDSAILEGGAGFKRISTTPKELKYPEGRRLTMEEIADGYGIPMSLLTPSESNRAVALTAYYQYMRDTIDPKLKLYEETMNEQMITKWGENFFVAFDDCVPEDRDFELRERESNLRTAYSVINELRKKDGLEPHEGYGDLPLVQMGTTELVVAGGEEEAEEEETPEKKLARSVAKELLSRMKRDVEE